MTEYRWERALLSLGDYFLRSGSNYSFLVNSASEQASWKRLLRGSTWENAHHARAILQRLLDQINLDIPLDEQLDNLIAIAEDLEPWRQIMVNTPDVFRYCGEHALRWNNDEIYLLKKSRMSGMHAELFSFHSHAELKAEQLQKKLLPLRLQEYQSVSGSEYEPYVSLALSFLSRSLSIAVFSTLGLFRIQVSRKLLKPLPNVEDLLVDKFKFDVHKEQITLDVARGRIHTTLRAIARNIKALEERMADGL